MSARIRIALFCLLIVAPVPGWAQRNAGLTGVINDPSGAVVPGVQVVARQQLSGVEKSTATNESGVYQFVELQPGPYEIKASTTGFKSYVTPVFLEVAHIATVNIRMEVGEVTQTVQVTAQAASLETQSPTVGSLVGEKMIQDMPVLSRSLFDFLPITMGFSTPWKGSGDPAIGGTIPGATSFYIDGGVATDSRLSVAGGLSYANKVEWMSEMKVVENSFKAEYGSNGGAIMLASTKTGTNGFHGSIFEFNRQSALAARNTFAIKKTPLNVNDFGAAVGGPIKRNKLFFFYSYDGVHSHTSFLSGQLNSVFQTVPTALQRAGDFSQTYNAAGKLTPIYDPYTTVLNPDGTISRQQISCQGKLNVICPDRLDNVALKVLSYVPLPNTNPTDPSGTNNFYGTGNGLSTANDHNVRIDYDLSNKTKIFGHFMRDDFTGEGYGPWPALQGFDASKIDHVSHTGGRNPANPSEYENYGSNTHVVVGWTRSISPNLVSDFHGGVAPRHWLYQHSSAGLNFPQAIGLPVPTPFSPKLPNGLPDNSFPSFSAGNYNLPGSDGWGAGQALPLMNIWHGQENIAWLHGDHSFKAGFEWMYSTMSRYQKNNASGTYSFSSGSTSSNGIDPASGNALAAMLLDFPVNGNLRDTDVQYFRTTYYSWFVQDDWRVRPNLTFNLGMRHDVDTPITETKNRIIGFDPTAINPVSGTPGVVTFPTRFTAPQNTNFSPRFGFSYNPKGGRTVIRGGYGMFFNESNQLDGWSIPGTARPDVSVSVSSVASSLFINQPPYSLETGLPAPPPFSPSQLNAGFGAVAKGQDGFYHPNFGVQYIPFHNKTGYQHHANFNIERQIGATVFELGWEGTYGRHLSVCNGGLGCSIETDIVTPAQQLALGAKQTSNDKPFPQFTSVTLVAPSAYNTWFNALYVKATRRYSNGFSYLTHFTWSKAMDDWSIFCCSQPDWYHRNGRGLSWTDRKFRYVFAGTYEVPAGRGRRFLQKGPLEYVLGGWKLSPILIAESGQPLTPFMSGVPGASRPDCVGNPNAGAHTLTSWWNPAAFQAPTPWTYGNCASGVIIGPRYVDLDASIQKDFPVWGESKKLEVRMDSYDFLNHPNYANPSTTVCPSTSPCTTNNITGTPPAQPYASRQIQLSLRFIF